MALIDDVKIVCDRLAGAGWRDLLRRHGLDIGAPDLAAELARELTDIDRTAPGFQDFHPDAVRGIEPGVPSMSLLYHAFASPGVHPSGDGTDALCAMAARYAAFLAFPRRLGPNDALLGGIVGVMDTTRTFLVPVHKLFSGSENLAGRNLAVSF